MVMTRKLYREYIDFIAYKVKKKEIDFVDTLDKDGDKIKPVYDINNLPIKKPNIYEMTPSSFKHFNESIRKKLRIR